MTSDKIGVHPTVKPSQLPFEVNGRHLILVDDILHTGRTVRAAMNEIFDYGRPLSISLVVLIARSGRELPIHADVCGADISLSKGEHVKLRGPRTTATRNMPRQLKKNVVPKEPIMF